MASYLLFQLYGPLAAWGETAVGEMRPSSAWPGKSAIVGLLGAALGLRREEEVSHRELCECFGMAVCVESTGELLRDYHTTQVPPERRGRVYRTRRDELRSDTLHTILSQRDYRMDALYRVAVWCRSELAPYSLERLRDALRKPVFNLYLGRKSCPPSLPLQPQLTEAESLFAAFEQSRFLGDSFLKTVPYAKERLFVWEKHDTPGLEAMQVFKRRDQVLSRKRWQFSERNEYYCSRAREEV
jgi:CRISPR system Cascade subunit CasD